MKTITTLEFKALKQKEPSVRVIDVREAVEYEREHLAGTRNVPLSALDPSAAAMDRTQPVYLLCQSGSRARQAVEKLQKKGYEHVCLIEGGLEALKAAGLDTVQGTSKVWAMDRQVRLGAGALVLTGILGAWWIHPGFLFLSAFVACGLIFSAVTDTCGMALVLGKCPWNQVKQ